MLFTKGCIPWNKGTKGIVKSNKTSFRKGDLFPKGIRKKISKAHKEKKLTEDHRRKLSERLKNHFVSDITRQKISNKLKGRKLTEESRRKIGKAHRGSKNYHWKGGIKTENQKIRNSIEIKLWRESVFTRDNWICKKCKIKGGKLVAHHIRNFAEAKELRTLVENGITFCKNCHQKFHRKYGIKHNNHEQLLNFYNQIV